MNHTERGNPITRALLTTAVAAMAAGALAACGGDDATVAGQPSTETLAPPPGAAGAPSSPRVVPRSDSGDYTEEPQPVDPSDAPGLTTPALDGRERGYLEDLQDNGVDTDVLTNPLVAAGNTICRIRTTGGAADETTTIANAVAGQLVAGGYSDVDVEELSEMVVEAASGQLCP